jgi:hypothetical protein
MSKRFGSHLEKRARKAGMQAHILAILISIKDQIIGSTLSQVESKERLIPVMNFSRIMDVIVAKAPTEDMARMLSFFRVFICSPAS